MSHRTLRLRRVQLDRFFTQVREAVSYKKPKSGWIRELRQVLGMSMSDLAIRLNVIPQRIERIEKDELKGKVTLETMEKAAEALDCDFIYFLVPRKTLEQTLEVQATLAAEAIMKDLSHSMELEKQKTSKASQKELIRSLAQEMLKKGDRRIWKIK